MLPPCIYTIGLLLLLFLLLPDDVLKSVKSSMWKEEVECLKWLDCHEAASVIYVNFGSTTVSTPQQQIEFAWGNANSNHPFLWVIRPDLVMGGHTILPQELMDEIEERGMHVSWYPQEDMLAYPSICLFLTHYGWNSTLESISYGVPMLCWPFFADQNTNCRYACNEWRVGIEIVQALWPRISLVLIIDIRQLASLPDGLDGSYIDHYSWWAPKDDPRCLISGLQSQFGAC
ncbi:hypothetical protein AAC387_Pa08g0793 [Persea americana]